VTCVLKGIQINPLKRRSDERGSFVELMTEDWIDLSKEDEIAQANLSACMHACHKMATSPKYRVEYSVLEEKCSTAALLTPSWKRACFSKKE